MLVVDAGPLVAAAATRDQNHSRCVELLRGAARPLIVPALVVTEVTYFLADRIGADADRAFAASIESGELIVEAVEQVDWERIVGLLDEYVDLGLGMVDASVLACCERLGETKLATLDQRHFAVVRPSHCDALTLLPE